jgi:AcrR family transcriptional regulator
VVRNQRDRIFAAVAEVTSEAGYAETSVEDIIARAGVSRRTFYDLFKNKQDAFLAAYDEVVERLLERVGDAQAEGDDFADRMRRALGTFLGSLALSPAFARMCIVEVLAAGPDAVRRRNDAMAAFVALIAKDAESQLGSELSSPLLAEMLVGGIYETLYRRLAEGRIEELEGLLPELLHAALLPYLGRDAAAAARDRLGDPSRASAA